MVVTDVSLAMRRAIASRVHTRVYIWNEDVAGEGFWSIVSIAPGGKHDEQMPKPAAPAHPPPP